MPLEGACNWKLTVRREAQGVEILRALTCDRAAALPETLFGMPVVALGEHALSPGKPCPAGESVEIAGGPENADWDNSRLEDLTLPGALSRVGRYALFHCRSLSALRLRDSVRLWGGGALSSRVSRIVLECTGREGEVLADLTGELPGELDVTLLRADASKVRLIFPEYSEFHVENCPAHHFDYRISGAGYGYHHCIRDRRLSLAAYDALWRPFLGLDHDPDCALRLAWWRLRCPAELSEAARADYLSYLRDHAAAAGRWLLERGDTAALRFLLDCAAPEAQVLETLCEAARERRATEALAILLTERRRRFPAGTDRSFAL